MKLLNTVKSAFYAAVAFIAQYKITSAVILAVVAAVTAAAIFISGLTATPDMISSGSVASDTSDDTSFVESVETVVSVPETVVSEEEKPISSAEVPVSSETPTVSSTPQPVTVPSVNTEYTYNSNMSYDNNVFLDALKYTGYKTDSRMWGAYGNYVLCSRKRGLGWLSEITYDNAGSASGYEVNEQGLPDIHYFTYRSNGSKRGLVCASYATYVYFNYLPNVAGIDTSMLPKPNDPVIANDWYIAAKKWVDLGYSRYINFTANDGGSINRDLKFTPEEEVPIGSLIFLCDWYNRTNWSTHVSIYAGTVNGYHWVTHVGNENGPELCAIERMNRLPHPQWMLAVITPPSNIRFAPSIQVTVKDENGNPMKDVSVSVKRTSNGVVTELGTTNGDGVVSGDGFSYGEYEVTQTVPDGYVCEQSTQTVNFTTQNNSLNTVNFTNRKQESNTENLKSIQSVDTTDGLNHED